jgi:hypothetical protein
MRWFFQNSVQYLVEGAIASGGKDKIKIFIARCRRQRYGMLGILRFENDSLSLLLKHGKYFAVKEFLFPGDAVDDDRYFHCPKDGNESYNFCDSLRMAKEY